MDIVLVGALGIASFIDWRFHRIPNSLTFPTALAGLIFQTVQNGTLGFLESLAGAMVGMALLYGPFRWGGVGGGDVKLLGAIGAFVGPWGVMKVFLVGACLGGVFSLFEIVREKRLKAVVENIKNAVLYSFLTQKVVPEAVLRRSSKTLHIPYAVPLGLGYIVTCFVWR